MDPISTAIVGALIAGATGVAERALNDAYEGLRTLIVRRFGGTSEVARAVDAVERDPESQRLRQGLELAIAQSGADRDAQIVRAADILRQQVEREPYGRQIIKDVRDSMVVGGDYVGRDSIGGDYAGGDYVRGDYIDGDYWNVSPENSMRLPETTVGWIITAPGLICLLVGFSLFFFNLISTISRGPSPGEGFPEGIGLGFGLVVVGILVTAVGGMIDQVLSRRAKRGR